MISPARHAVCRDVLNLLSQVGHLAGAAALDKVLMRWLPDEDARLLGVGSKPCADHAHGRSKHGYTTSARGCKDKILLIVVKIVLLAQLRSRQVQSALQYAQIELLFLYRGEKYGSTFF